jgi:hypothetical protein
MNSAGVYTPATKIAGVFVASYVLKIVVQSKVVRMA